MRKDGEDMGHRALYRLVEQNSNAYFYAYWGANALSPLIRLQQAREIQAQIPDKQSLAHIFEHLDYNGRYVNPRANDPDMFCKRIPKEAIRDYIKGFEEKSELEMRITLDPDNNNCLLEYNRQCYRGLGSFSIPLDTGLENVKKLLKATEEKGIDDFYRLLDIYHRATGLYTALEASKAQMDFEEHAMPEIRNEPQERLPSMEDDNDFEMEV